MKKLIAVILILALLLSAAAALSEGESFRIVRHYSLFIDGRAPQIYTAKGGKLFDFDSFTVDIYLDEEGTNGYYIDTTCTDGLFLTSGMDKIRVMDKWGQLLIIFGNGENIPIEWDEDGSLWLQFSRGWFRLQQVTGFDVSADWK